MREELDLYQQIALRASEIPKTFTDPGDDWAPFAFLQLRDEDAIPTLPLGMFMESAGSKDVLAEIILPEAIKQLKAVRVILLLSVWTSKMAGASLATGQIVQPSECIDREEKVCIMEITADGVQRQAAAPIIRLADAPPKLGEWEDWPTASAEGRFVTPLVGALRETA